MGRWRYGRPAMTVRLTVQREAWERHVAAVAAEVEGLVPVVKGNGYGFGRPTLHPVAAELSTRRCVGTVHELDHVAPGVTPVVLTPTLYASCDDVAASTVGAPSTTNAAPFTNDDSSLARNSAASTISRGLPSRPIGQWILRRS